MALGIVCLAWGDFVLGQPVPKDFPDRTAQHLAIAAGGLILFATSAQIDDQIDAALDARRARLGQIAFAVCVLLFGGAHFAYMNFTATLVPKWLPRLKCSGVMRPGLASSPRALRS